jgi:hypothetical protein
MDTLVGAVPKNQIVQKMAPYLSSREINLSAVKESSAGFFSTFDFLISFLGECRNETDYRPALIRMRQKYEQLEDRAVQFESRLARSNMETLMLQGDRPPVISGAEAREKIDRIVMLLDALYGV